jgi:hypothetical protein
MEKLVNAVVIITTVASMGLGINAMATLGSTDVRGTVESIIQSQSKPKAFDAEEQGLCMSFEDSDACDNRLYNLGDIDADCEGVKCLVGAK